MGQEPSAKAPTALDDRSLRPTGLVEVSWISSAEVPSTASDFLDERELQRLRNIQNPQAAKDYLAAHFAARVAIGDRLGIRPNEVRFTMNGLESGGSVKPLIVGTNLQFSLSHSSGMGVVALSHAESVGVDCEHRERRTNRQFLDRILSVKEKEVPVRVLEGGTRAALTVWTRKEAALKALGMGLRIDPRDLVVEADHVFLYPGSLAETQLPVRTKSFQLGDSHICAVTILSSDLHVRDTTDELTASVQRLRSHTRNRTVAMVR
ncbi:MULTISPECIES: 4'-phosphopantetheinyl transferase family protein [Brevibacterium]|mgnify:CR=1 FL=1|nr:4'-phosphopantetheinyl transferase superfamily protein [Brevibacterium aurantiacum]